MKFDTIIVGAGIAGLSLARALNQLGRAVLVLEKSETAQGASIRNFGMVWPVGHPVGKWRDLALRSREIWIEVGREADIWVNPCGSVTLAYEELEHTVLQEFFDSVNGDPSVGRFLDPDQVVAINPLIRREGLKAGFQSSTELCVDPREVVHKLAPNLIQTGVSIRFGTAVAQVLPGKIVTTTGEEFVADSIVVCAGPEVRSLLPMVNSLRKCKLQMMRLAPRGDAALSMAHHLCAGLTLGHYANFRDCPSLPALKNVHREKWPLQTEWGIHVLVSQHADGTLTLGDSHEYGESTHPYHRESVDQAILAALDEFLDVSDFQVMERWDGYYNTTPGEFYSWIDLGDKIYSLNLFGTGMTLSFGVAEEISRRLNWPS